MNKLYFFILVSIVILTVYVIHSTSSKPNKPLLITHNTKNNKLLVESFSKLDDLISDVKSLWVQVTSIGGEITTAAENVLNLGKEIVRGIDEGAQNLASGIQNVENKIETGIEDAAKGVEEVAKKIPAIAENIAEEAIKDIKTDINVVTNLGENTLKSGKKIILSIPNVIKGVTEHIPDFFNTLKEFFNQIETFSDLLLILMKRTLNCVGGGSKALENYMKDCSLKYITMIESLSNFSKCGDSIFGIYHNCWVPSGHVKIAASDFFTSVKTWWNEVLTFPEMRPQGSNMDWCNKNFKIFTSTENSLEYAKKCNECLYVKGIISLGIGEIENIGIIITKLLTVAMNILEGLFSVGPLITQEVTDLESIIKPLISELPGL